MNKKIRPDEMQLSNQMWLADRANDDTQEMLFHAADLAEESAANQMHTFAADYIKVIAHAGKKAQIRVDIRALHQRNILQLRQ